MSAFMCDDKHLSALAFYAVRELRLGDRGFATSHQEIFTLLWDENRKSLEARYPKSAAEMVGSAEPPPFDTSVATACNFDPVRVIKASHCYRYQACEHDGFDGSPADKLTQAIINHAIHDAPGYAQAPWGAP
jgi:hypothetical protein